MAAISCEPFGRLAVPELGKVRMVQHEGELWPVGGRRSVWCACSCFGLELVLDVGVRATRLTGFVERGLGLAMNTADVDVVVDTVEVRAA